MRLTTIVLSLCAVSVLTACGTRRETIVERPTVIQSAPAAATGGSAAGCVYGSSQYSDGAMACQNGAPYRCRSGTWERSLGSC